MTQMDRRKFLTYTLLTTPGVSLVLGGCRHLQATGEKIDDAGNIVVGAGTAITFCAPSVEAKEIGLIITLVGTVVSAAGSGMKTVATYHPDLGKFINDPRKVAHHDTKFSGGDVLVVSGKNKTSKEPEKDSLTEIDLEKASAFAKAAGDDYKFNTPVVAVRSDRRDGVQKQLYVQSVSGVRKMLVLGADGKAYWVLEGIVDWLLNRDNCDRQIAGNTGDPEECNGLTHRKSADCPVKIRSQEFIYTGTNKRETLYFIADNRSSKEAKARHQNLSVPYEDCSDIDGCQAPSEAENVGK